MDTTDREIEIRFPLIGEEGYKVTSPSDHKYNCVAWAASDNQKWWWPDSMHQYYWPIEKTECTLDSFRSSFASLGFVTCDSEELEGDFEKVAVYTSKNGVPLHVARQVASGEWTSKLGAYKDIEHATLDGVSGDVYGYATLIMRKPIKPNQTVFS